MGGVVPGEHESELLTGTAPYVDAAKSLWSLEPPATGRLLRNIACVIHRQPLRLRLSRPNDRARKSSTDRHPGSWPRFR